MKLSGQHEKDSDLQRLLSPTRVVDYNSCEHDPVPFQYDKGIAWVQILAVFFLYFITSGSYCSFGVYQNYYVHDMFHETASNAEIAVIGSLGGGLRELLGVAAGPLAARIGFRTSIIIGASLIVLGFEAASFCHTVPQLYLTQGAMTGVGGALVFFPASCVPAQWFLRHRGLANGVAASGAGIGGFAMSNSVEYLLINYGMKTALRTQGCLIFTLSAIAIALLQTHEGAQETRSDNTDLSILRNPFFVAFAVATGIMAFGYEVPFNYVPIYARTLDISASNGAMILGMISVASTIGRIVIGRVSDYTGALPALTASFAVSSALCLLLWPFATTYASLISFALLYGFFSGGMISLLTTTLANEFGSSRLALTTGITYTLSSMGSMLGAPIGALIMTAFSNVDVTQTDTPGWFVPGMMWCGALMAISTILMTGLALHRHSNSSPLGPNPQPILLV